MKHQRFKLIGTISFAENTASGLIEHTASEPESKALFLFLSGRQ
jgi:hypothetical protein